MLLLHAGEGCVARVSDQPVTVFSIDLSVTDLKVCFFAPLS